MIKIALFAVAAFLVGCVTEPEPRRHNITCNIFTDSDPMNGDQDTVSVKDGGCE